MINNDKGLTDSGTNKQTRKTNNQKKKEEINKLKTNYSFIYQPVSKLICWTPSYGHSKRGRKCTTPDSIVKDLDLEPNEIQQLMKDKTVWRKFVSAASTIPSTANLNYVALVIYIPGVTKTKTFCCESFSTTI